MIGLHCRRVVPVPLTSTVLTLRSLKLPTVRARTAVAVVACLAAGALHAGSPQESVVFLPPDARSADRVALSEGSGNQPAVPDDPTALPPDLRWQTAAVIGGGVAAITAYGLSQWWDDGFGGGFKTSSEGWFGTDTRYGGADKLGHVYTGYAGTRIVAAMLHGMGHSRESAATIGFAATLGTLTAVEVADGFSEQYDFSWEDAVANAVGAGFAWLVERDPKLDSLLDFRLYYRRSNESDSWDPAGDYGGQRYLLVAKASGVPQFADIPGLRYLELAVGYGARGFDPPPGTAPEPERSLYVGISLNLSAILEDTAFRDGRWAGARRATDLFLDLWQIPGTGAYAKNRL